MALICTPDKQELFYPFQMDLMQLKEGVLQQRSLVYKKTRPDTRLPQSRAGGQEQ